MFNEQKVGGLRFAALCASRFSQPLTLRPPACFLLRKKFRRKWIFFLTEQNTGIWLLVERSNACWEPSQVGGSASPGQTRCAASILHTFPSHLFFIAGRGKKTFWRIDNELF